MSRDFSTMKKEVNDRLVYLNTVYLNSLNEPVFGKGTMNIIDLDGTSVNAKFNFVNIDDAKISIFSNYIYIDTSIININSYKNVNMSEINCLTLLDHTNANNTDTLNFITGLYTLYGILNADYFDSFILNTKENIPNRPLNIPVYDKITQRIIFKDVSTDCGTHSNVEWVFTYYRPQQSGNIIINTFLNMIKNLLRHLSDLQPITGNFIMKYKDDEGKNLELYIYYSYCF